MTRGNPNTTSIDPTQALNQAYEEDLQSAYDALSEGFTGGNQGGNEVNKHWRDRMIGNKAFGKIGEIPRYFVIPRCKPLDIYDTVQVWLKVAFNQQTGKEIPVPFYSSASIRKWFKEGSKGKYFDYKNPPAECPLAAVFRDCPDMIARSQYNVKNFNLSPLYIVEAFELTFEHSRSVINGKTSFQVKKINGKIPWKLDPTPWILQLRPIWFAQWRDKVLSPKPVQDIQDPTATPHDPAPLPSKNPGEIILVLSSRTDPNKKPGAKFNVMYEINFVADDTWRSPINPSETLPEYVTEENGVRVSHPDWKEVFPPITQEEVDKLIERWNNSEQGLAGDKTGGEIPPEVGEDAQEVDEGVPF